jgi:hypothetical protein
MHALWSSLSTPIVRVATAADRRGFAQQLGKAIKRPSSTSDIPLPEDDAKASAPMQFPPTYEDPPGFARNSNHTAHPLPEHNGVDSAAVKGVMQSGENGAQAGTPEPASIATHAASI